MTRNAVGIKHVPPLRDYNSLWSGHVHNQQAHSSHDRESDLYKNIYPCQGCEGGGRGRFLILTTVGTGWCSHLPPGWSSSISSPRERNLPCFYLGSVIALRKSSNTNQSYANVRGLLPT